MLETACRLVGKVNYFWGGKSLVLGWDDRWGTLRQVTAAGSSTTGTYRPYGMDCIKETQAIESTVHPEQKLIVETGRNPNKSTTGLMITPPPIPTTAPTVEASRHTKNKTNETIMPSIFCI